MLEKLPGYTFPAWPCQAARREEHPLQPALVEIEDALVPALIVEKLEDGSYTVLVPSAPTPMAGSIYILPADRVHPVDIPFTKAIGVFSKWGTGAGEFVRAMKAPAGAPAAPCHHAGRSSPYRVFVPSGGIDASSPAHALGRTERQAARVCSASCCPR